MTQTLTNDSRLKLAAGDEIQEIIIRVSDQKEDVKIQLSHKLDVKLTVLYESRQLEKLDNNKGDEKRESWWLRIKCLLKGEAAPSTDEWTEKHLIYDLGLLYYSRGQGERRV